MVSEVEQRRLQLDHHITRPGCGLEDLVRAFVAVMAGITEEGLPIEMTPLLRRTDLPTSDASGVVRVLREVAGWLDQGPCSAECEQRWISTQRPIWLDSVTMNPSPKDVFKGTSSAPSLKMSQPWDFGLHTSSATKQFPGMWRRYLEKFSGNTLWRKPWYTWTMRPANTTRVFNIDIPDNWCDLIVRYPFRDESDLLWPDWKSVAREYDAVHFAPAAIFGIQGYRIDVGTGITAPVYIDVENTFWLNWTFVDWTIVESETG